MMDKNEFEIKLNIENIGPHYGDNKIDFAKKVDSNKAIFFATNGTGKSFISRMFRLNAQEKHNVPANDLLTLGSDIGNMVFNIVNGLTTNTFSVRIEREKTPLITNTAGLIFHVFNNDFVEENIKPNNYTQNGNIEGYILGKTQIDLTDEKEKENVFKENVSNICKDIDKLIDDSKQELRDLGVEPNTTEFKIFTTTDMRVQKNFDDISSFDSIVMQLDKLGKIPENLSDIIVPTINIDFLCMNEIATILSTAYPKSEWDDSFVEIYKNNRNFIEEGLSLTKESKTCPFCNQTFNDDAMALIQKYNAYRKDKEAQLLAQLDKMLEQIKKIIELIKNSTGQIETADANVNKVKEFFPSISNFSLMRIDAMEEMLRPFHKLLKLLGDKSNDLTKILPDTQVVIEQCNEVKKSIEYVFSNNSNIILTINKVKNNTNAERLSLRKNLCKAKFSSCQLALNPIFEKLDVEKKLLDDLRESILIKEQQVKISKKEKVYNTVTSFLNLFFDGKYTIDEDSFQIRFLGNNIGENVSRVLSDGEKSIVAYCYYLATTHLLVSKEDDYNKLFFIIDDPISSMDFHYVYMVAQSLRDIKSIFGITGHERVWVLTHNMEFLSIIVRNKILNTSYILKPGQISIIDERLLLPYESHLNDIVKIAKGLQEPNHTTSNSIRHILETICRFEYPEKRIEGYVAENTVLSNNACIYTICQDLSHGGIRNQLPFSTDILKSACKTIVDFMNIKYKGQIDAIRIR